MPKITTIDKNAAKVLHERLSAAIRASAEIAAVCAEFGLKLEAGHASYDDTKITVSFTAKIDGAVSESVVQLAAMYGLDAAKRGVGKHEGLRIVGHGRGRMP